jgi:hypothetical protein
VEQQHEDRLGHNAAAAAAASAQAAKKNAKRQLAKQRKADAEQHQDGSSSSGMPGSVAAASGSTSDSDEDSWAGDLSYVDADDVASIAPGAFSLEQYIQFEDSDNEESEEFRFTAEHESWAMGGDVMDSRAAVAAADGVDSPWSCSAAADSAADPWGQAVASGGLAAWGAGSSTGSPAAAAAAWESSSCTADPWTHSTIISDAAAPAASADTADWWTVGHSQFGAEHSSQAWAGVGWGDAAMQQQQDQRWQQHQMLQQQQQVGVSALSGQPLSLTLCSNACIGTGSGCVGVAAALAAPLAGLSVHTQAAATTVLGQSGTAQQHTAEHAKWQQAPQQQLKVQLSALHGSSVSDAFAVEKCAWLKQQQPASAVIIAACQAAAAEDATDEELLALLCS